MKYSHIKTETKKERKEDGRGCVRQAGTYVGIFDIKTLTVNDSQ